MLSARWQQESLLFQIKSVWFQVLGTWRQYNLMIRDFPLRQATFKSWLHYSLAVWLRASYIATLCFSDTICKKGIKNCTCIKKKKKIVPASQKCENEVRQWKILSTYSERSINFVCYFSLHSTKIKLIELLPQQQGRFQNGRFFHFS